LDKENSIDIEENQRINQQKKESYKVMIKNTDNNK